MSPELKEEGKLEKALQIAGPMEAFHTNFDTLFTPEERKTSAWKQLNESQLKEITTAHKQKWNYPQDKHQDVEQALLQTQLRIHMDVEEFHLSTFIPRVLRFPTDQLLEAAELFKSQPQECIERQERAPLGMLSPYLLDMDRKTKAAELMQTTAEELEEWLADPKTQFAGNEQCKSDWMKMSKQEVETIMANYCQMHQIEDNEAKAHMMTVVMIQFARIHCDVELLSFRSFYNRLLYLTPAQFDEIKLWFSANCKINLLRLKPIVPEKHKYYEPVGDGSPFVVEAPTKAQVELIISRLLQGLVLPMGTTSSWAMLSNNSKKLLMRVIGKTWPNSIPKDETQKLILRKLLMCGFLRIHMEVERQPFETFYPRFYREDPTSWEHTLKCWMEHCKPSSGQGATQQLEPTPGEGAAA